MTDFYQTGMVTTLHRLGKINTERLEKELKRYTRHNPVALVLPALYSDLMSKAMQGILEELKKITYLKEIVVSLGRANQDEFKNVRKLLSKLPQEVKIVWDSGERMNRLYQLLKNNGIFIGEEGKGRNVWIAFGYVIANEKSRGIVLHDCDILTYSKDLLLRLCYPLMNPNLAYEFVKGYYARVTDRLHGRVTRLFVTPLIRALQTIVGHLPFLTFLDSFRYPLAGEIAITTDLARIIRIPNDWGLEIGMLREIFRHCAVRRICDVNICENYDHKHQPLSTDDPTKGLVRMSADIAKSLFHALFSEGIEITSHFFKGVKAAYLKQAQDSIKKYADDAAINSLFFDLHEEEVAVEAFTNAIDIAATQVLEAPAGVALIPNWARAASAIPDILEQLKQIVDEDNK